MRSATPRGDPVPVYSLSFGFSSSPNYRRALSLAQALPGYEAEGDGRGVRHLVPLSGEHLDQLAELLGLVIGWRGTALTADGVVLGCARWWALRQVLVCHRDRELSGLEELHCRGLPAARGRVPCRLLEYRLPWELTDEYADPAFLPRLRLAHAREAMVDACPAYDPEAATRAALQQLDRPRRGRASGSSSCCATSTSATTGRPCPIAELEPAPRPTDELLPADSTARKG